LGIKNKQLNCNSYQNTLTHLFTCFYFICTGSLVKCFFSSYQRFLWITL